MKSYFDDLRLRLNEAVPFPTRLIAHAESPFRLGGFDVTEVDYRTLEQRLRVIDEAHKPILRANISAYGLGVRKPTLLSRMTVGAAVSSHVWKFPTIKETHRAAYDAIRATIKSDEMYFDTLTDFVSLGARTGRFSSTKPNYSAPPSTAVYVGARGNGKTFAQQHYFEHQLKRNYVLKPYQREMLEELRALYRKGWKL